MTSNSVAPFIKAILVVPGTQSTMNETSIWVVAAGEKGGALVRPGTCDATTGCGGFGAVFAVEIHGEWIAHQDSPRLLRAIERNKPLGSGW